MNILNKMEQRAEEILKATELQAKLDMMKEMTQAFGEQDRQARMHQWPAQKILEETAELLKAGIISIHVTSYLDNLSSREQVIETLTPLLESAEDAAEVVDRVVQLAKERDIQQQVSNWFNSTNHPEA